MVSKKKGWQIYSMLLSEGAVHNDQDRATKTTLSTTELQISHSDSFIRLKCTCTIVPLEP